MEQACLSSIESFLDTFFSRPRDVLAGISFMGYIQLFKAIVSLSERWLD